MTAASLSATPIHAECKRIFLHESHPTPDVVFLYVNINMGTAVHKATKGKNRLTLNAIFFPANPEATAGMFDSV